MTVTRDQAIQAGLLAYSSPTRNAGHAIFHRSTDEECSATPWVWRSNGSCKIWVTRPDEFRLPIKHGLRDCSAITHHNADKFHLAGDCPQLKAAGDTVSNLVKGASHEHS